MLRGRAPSAGSVRLQPASPRDFCAYLILVAALSIAGYLVGRCGVIDFYTMRYELLSVLGACGLAGWYLRVERSRAWSAPCGRSAAPRIFALSVVAPRRACSPSTRRARRVPLKQELIRALDARDIRYAYADYWTAYYVTFMTRERIIVASTRS